MNYIKTQQIEKSGLQQQLDSLLVGLDDLRSYLCSPKFNTDTTVQTADVLHRISQIKSYAFDQRIEIENAQYAELKASEQAIAEQPKFNCEVPGCNYFGRNYKIIGVQVVCHKCQKNMA